MFFNVVVVQPQLTTKYTIATKHLTIACSLSPQQDRDRILPPHLFHLGLTRRLAPRAALSRLLRDLRAAALTYPQPQ